MALFRHLLTEGAGPLDTEDILAAFRKHKEAKAGQSASEPETAAESAPEPANAPTDPKATPEASDASAAPEVPNESPPPASVEPEVSTPTPEPAPTPKDVIDAPDAKIEDRPKSLVVTSPALRLTERLHADATLMVQGSRIGRLVAGAVCLTSLLVLLVILRANKLGGADISGGWTVFLSTIAALAAAAAAGFYFYPPERHVSVRLMGDQQEEWARVQAQAKLLQWQWIASLAVLGFGIVFLLITYAWFSPDAIQVAQVFGFILVLAGVGSTISVLSRRGAVHRLYIQTLVLSTLEHKGMVTGRDARVGPVLRALDELLGALPESTVRSFLSSKEAKVYLQMIEELDEDP